MTPEQRKQYYRLVAKHNGEPKEVSEYAAALLGALHAYDAVSEELALLQKTFDEMSEAGEINEDRQST